MEQRLYHSGQFAQKARVSVRTLRYYDREGLLSPSRHSAAGYRLYSDEDLVNLQQILALKFLGFTLEEIKAYLQAEPEKFQQALARQKTMMLERRAQLEAIIWAIEKTQRLLETGERDWEAIVNVIEVIQMEQKKDWLNKYFTPEQREKMQELIKRSYSEEAHRKMAGWEWTEEDQKRVDAQYAHIASELKRLIAEGKDPDSPEAQAVAKLQVDLRQQFTKGDSDIEVGLKTWWQNYQALPEEEKPPALPWDEEEGEFLAKAVAIYQKASGEG